MIGVISYGNRRRRSNCFTGKKKRSPPVGVGGAKRAKKARNARGGHAGSSTGREKAALALAVVNCGWEEDAAKTANRAKSKQQQRHRAAEPRTSRRLRSASVTGAEAAAVAAASKKQEQVRSTSSASLADGGVGSEMCENNPVPVGGGYGGRKRGHQHHPRFGGSRKSNVPAEDVIAALREAFDGGAAITTSTVIVGGGGGSISSSSSSSSLLIGGGTAGSIVNTDIIIDENANPQLLVSQNVTEEDGAEEEAQDKQTMMMAIDDDEDDVVDDDLVNNNSNSLGQDLNPEVGEEEEDEDLESDLIKQSKNKGSNSISNSLVSSELSNSTTSTTSKVIVIDDEELLELDGEVPLLESKLEEEVAASGPELVKQISKKLKRSKKSPSSDDSSSAASRKKSSSSKKSSKNSDGSSSGTTVTKVRKKVRSADKLERASGDGASCEDGGSGLGGGVGGPADENDPDVAEWAKLRCTSERTEVIAEREHRRQKRCADYPGLAFGRSIFSSDTMMKFNIIRNELHNIMKTQLKRVIIARHSPISFRRCPTSSISG